MRNGWRVQGGGAGLRFLREHCWGEEEIILARKATLLCIGHGMKCFYLAVFSRSVMSDSLQLHGLQPARLLCPGNFLSKNMRCVVISTSRAPSRHRHQTRVSCIGNRILYHRDVWEVLSQVRNLQCFSLSRTALWQWKWSVSAASNTVATRRIWLLNTWTIAFTTEFLILFELTWIASCG